MADRTGHFDKDCLTSIVRNDSGVTKAFGFLPPHGVTLEADEEYTVFGNILEAVARGKNAGASRRNHQGLFDALDKGILTILHTPAPILLDETTDATKRLRLNNGTLSVANPCWDTSDSLDDTTPP